MTAPSNRARRRRSRAHAVLLLLAMAGLLGLCGWIVAGWHGIEWSIIAGTVALVMVGRAPADMFLRAMDARRLGPEQAPLLLQSFATLCRRAGLAPVPALCHVDAEEPLAFSLGRGAGAAVVVADSLIAGLAQPELDGILAHEIVHLRNGDIILKQLGFALGWVTRIMTQFGIILLLVGVVLRVVSTERFPLLSLLVLATAPTAVSFLQLALARAREAEADLEAAELTGDPAGLASALVKLHRWQQRRLHRLLPDAHLFRLPTIFRDHPPTEERIRRLMTLAQQRGDG